jgi:hypothetical protein
MMVDAEEVSMSMWTEADLVSTCFENLPWHRLGSPFHVRNCFLTVFKKDFDIFDIQHRVVFYPFRLS